MQSREVLPLSHRHTQTHTHPTWYGAVTGSVYDVCCLAFMQPQPLRQFTRSPHPGRSSAAERMWWWDLFGVIYSV